MTKPLGNGKCWLPHLGISWAICKSAPRPRQTTTPEPTTHFLQARCPSCRPTYSIKAL